MVSQKQTDKKSNAALDKLQQQEANKKKEESDAAWKQFEAKKQAEKDEEDYAQEVCPCGHKCYQHYGSEGSCEVSSCHCHHFGESIEDCEDEDSIDRDCETAREINLGDDPGRFKIYE